MLGATMPRSDDQADLPGQLHFDNQTEGNTMTANPQPESLQPVFDFRRPDRLEQATRLAGCGLCVMAVPLGAKKRTEAWKHYQTERPSEEALKEMMRAPTNLAIVTGAISGVVVVDCDNPKAEEWADTNLPPTPILTATGKGGHRFYRHPGKGHVVSNRARIKIPGAAPDVEIDIRGDGGYVCAPGSLHPSGAIYRAEGEWTTEAFESLPPFPLSLLETPAPPPAPTPTPAPVEASRRVGRPVARARAAADIAKIPASQGERNSTCFYISNRIITGYDLGEKDEDLAKDWNEQNCSPPLSEFERQTCWRQALDAKGKNPKYPTGYLLNKDRADYRSSNDLPLIGGRHVDEITPPATTSEEHQAEPEHEEPEPMPWPEPIATEGMIGFLGDLVRTLEPHTEADVNALHVQALIGIGHLIGLGPFFMTEATKQGTNEFAVIVGDSSTGRKGTTWGRVESVLLAAVGAGPYGLQKLAGFGSGEAMVWSFSDDQPTDEKKTLAEITDRKRILIMEAEFSAILRVASRDGNTSSQQFRSLWDGAPLHNITKGTKLVATGHHGSVIGHITPVELQAALTSVDIANGLANRHLFVLARRSKYLAHGGNLQDSEHQRLAQDLKRRLDWIRRAGAVHMIHDSAAYDLWEQIYPSLSDGQMGFAGEVLSRGATHVHRISIIFALLDCSSMVRVEHLLAALAVWDYCVRSVRYLFKDRLGNAMADLILSELRESDNGMTRKEISHDLFKRNKTAAQITQALKMLVDQKLAFKVQEKKPGFQKPTERWFATSALSIAKERDLVKSYKIVGRNVVTPEMSYLEQAKAFLREKNGTEEHTLPASHTTNLYDFTAKESYESNNPSSESPSTTLRPTNLHDFTVEPPEAPPIINNAHWDDDDIEVF